MERGMKSKDSSTLAELSARMDAFERNYVKKSELQKIHTTLEDYGENLAGLNKKLDNMELKWNERFGDLERFMNAQDERMTVLERHMNAQDERLAVLEGEMKKLLRHFGIE